MKQWAGELVEILADEGNRLVFIALLVAGAALLGGMLLTAWEPIAPLGQFLFGSATLLGPVLIAAALITGCMGMWGKQPFWTTAAPANLGLALLAIAAYSTPWHPGALPVPVGLFLVVLWASRMAHRQLGTPWTGPVLLCVAALGVIPTIGSPGPLTAAAVFFGVWHGKPGRDQDEA